MIFTVENTHNRFEHARRKKQYLQLIHEAGAKVTGTTDEGFSVEFPRATSRAEVQQFISSVAAIGTRDGETPGDLLVTAEPSDAFVLTGDSVNAPILKTALERGDIAVREVLPEDFFTTIDNAAFGPDVNSMSEAEQEEAYQNMLAVRGESTTDSDFAPRPRELSSLEQMIADNNAEFEKLGKKPPSRVELESTVRVRR